MAEKTNTYPHEEQRPSEDPETLGNILTTARDRQGLTVEQLAAELRVEARLLEALEEDRFELLPAPVFVKGYIRHMARRLGLDYDDLVRRYTKQTDVQDAPVTYSEPISEDNKLLVPLIIGALVLIVGIPAFWFTWVSRDSFSNVSSDEQAPEPPPAQVEPVPEEVAPLPVPGVAVEPATQLPAIELDPVQPSIAETTPGEESAPDDTSAAEPGATAVTDTVATGQVTEPLVQVTLDYEEDSWTEVTDGNGISLYYALGRAGTTASLDGVLPLSFMLGNFRGVQVSINNQPWPVPVPQGNATTVRFVVEEAP